MPGARRAMEEGTSAAELRHAALLALTTAGFPSMISVLKWIDKVIKKRNVHFKGFNPFSIQLSILLSDVVWHSQITKTFHPKCPRAFLTSLNLTIFLENLAFQ